ncbi:MAG: pectate lyase, partial [Pirellulales bacterium]
MQPQFVNDKHVSPLINPEMGVACLPIILVMAILLWTLNCPVNCCAAGPSEISPEQVSAGLHRAVAFYRTKVSSHGGYLWRYASEFTEREGELPASTTTVWVQPPGTPSVGLAYLSVYQLTDDDFYLDAVRETAFALVAGQLESGGWDYRIEFASPDREKYAYRVEMPVPNQGARNVTTLDDNTTQAALSFLMLADRALAFEESSIHESVKYALSSLLAAQYPNGAWPQRFISPPEREKFPVLPANYPEEWPRNYPKEDYRSYYTFNDNTMADMIELMFLAAAIYEDEQFSAAGKRAGDVILLSQLPEPQPGWAQQYNAQMHPAWARKFEPAAITGAESQRVMETLLRLFELTR